MNKKGFTLIEILATIVIIAMLAGIATVAYSSLIKQADTTVYETYEDTMYSEAAYKLTMQSENVHFSENKAKLTLNDLEIEPFKNPEDANDLCPRSFVEVTQSYVGSVLNTEYTVCLVCDSYNTDGSNCKKYPQRERTAVSPSSVISRIDFPSCSNRFYDGTNQLLFAQHSSGGYTNDALYGKNVGTYSVYLTPRNGYVWADNESNSSRELKCSIIQRPKQTPTIYVDWEDSITYPNIISKSVITNSDGVLSCRSSNSNIVSCLMENGKIYLTPKAYNSDVHVLITISVPETSNYSEFNQSFDIKYNRQAIGSCISVGATWQYDGQNHSSGVNCPQNSVLVSGGGATAPGTYYQVCNANSGYKFFNGNTTCETQWEILQPISTPTPPPQCQVRCRCACRNGATTYNNSLVGSSCTSTSSACQNKCVSSCSSQGGLISATVERCTCY